MKTLITLLLLGAVLALRPATAAPQGTAGPLVGNVTPTTATLWIFAPEGAKCSVRANPDGAAVDEKNAAEGTFTPVAQPAGKAHGKPAKVTLTGLLPDTAYRYTVGIDGKSDPALHGAFRTQPAPGTSNKFRMVLTSCMKFDQPQGSWKHVLAEKPQLHLTVGDTHYADTTNPTTQWEHHLRYRRMPEFAAVLRNLPTYSMWDDHDYGPNDSDRTTKGKENSLAGWNQFWGNPAAGTATTPGAFYKFSWGEVDFFMVDGRYHRSPDKAPDDDKKRMLGDAQFAWLIAGLKSSKAKFKVIASGSTLNHSKADGWRIYTFARTASSTPSRSTGFQAWFTCQATSIARSSGNTTSRSASATRWSSHLVRRGQQQNPEFCDHRLRYHRGRPHHAGPRHPRRQEGRDRSHLELSQLTQK